MWYFTWVLGVGFALFLAILNALWLENAEARMAALRNPKQDNHEHDKGA
jgi:cyd operon protein YbgT